MSQIAAFSRDLKQSYESITRRSAQQWPVADFLGDANLRKMLRATSQLFFCRTNTILEFYLSDEFSAMLLTIAADPVRMSYPDVTQRVVEHMVEDLVAQWERKQRILREAQIIPSLTPRIRLRPKKRKERIASDDRGFGVLPMSRECMDRFLDEVV